MVTIKIFHANPCVTTQIRVSDETFLLLCPTITFESKISNDIRRYLGGLKPEYLTAQQCARIYKTLGERIEIAYVVNAKKVFERIFNIV